MAVADHAAQAAELFLEQALAQAAHRAPRGVSASHCADCGEEISAARRVAVPGCGRCAECQAIAERRELIGRRTGR